MGSIKILVMERYLRRIKAIAKEYGLGKSDLCNEIFEWVLDQEDDFRRDLEKDLKSGEEVEVAPEDIEEDEEEDEEEEEEESE